MKTYSTCLRSRAVHWCSIGRSDGLTMDQQEPVRIEITDVFDLHSVPPRDARDVVEEYLDEAHRLGLKALRIIHGRGIGAQREMVRKILGSKDYVADFRDAPAEAGGWGATVVTLR
jgi:dsDNA-specific endonuclease/ATPase MutS2